jgi:hypothetical protein
MKWKLMRALLLVGLLCGAYFAGKQLNPVTKTEQIEVEKIVTQRVIERVTAPDGTVKETVTENTTSDTIASNEKNVTTAPPSRPDWRASLLWTPRMDVTTPAELLTPTGGAVERRILGPVWLGVGIDWYDPAITLSASMEF